MGRVLRIISKTSNWDHGGKALLIAFHMCAMAFARNIFHENAVARTERPLMSVAGCHLEMALLSKLKTAPSADGLTRQSSLKVA